MKSRTVEIKKAKSSRPKELVYDPFLGSGTTLIAAHQTGRQCRAIEIEPKYVAVTLQRFYDLTGIKPTLIKNINEVKNHE